MSVIEQNSILRGCIANEIKQKEDNYERYDDNNAGVGG